MSLHYTFPSITLPTQIITPDAKRLQSYLQEVDKSLPSQLELIVYGSAAVSIYLADSSRMVVGMTDDIDIQIGTNVKQLNDIAPQIIPPLEFRSSVVTNWLIHPDWENNLVNASRILELKKMNLHLLSPQDLILTKLGRYLERDVEDCTHLVKKYIQNENKGLFESYLKEALSYAIAIHPTVLRRLKEDVIEDLFDE